MAKARSSSPGMSDRGGVCSTMTPAFNKPSMGSQGTMGGPFNAPRSGGDNGLPTKVFDNMGGPKKAPKFSQTGPSAQGPSRPGTK